MTTLTAVQRAAIVKFNVGFDGWGDGTGYPGESPNPACEHFHVATTYSCAYGNSFACDASGHPLISMQSGMSTGYAYCPYGLDTARERHAIRGSWTTLPADLLFIDTGSGAQPGHTEMVIFRNSGPDLQKALEKILGVKLTAAEDVMYSFGWDSGPSNVDRFHGQGGCHVHMWHVPKGVGNPNIIAAADTSKLVLTASIPKSTPTVAAAVHKTAGKHAAKGTPLAKDTQSKVITVTSRLTHRTKPVKAGTGDRKRLEALRAAITEDLNRKA